MQNSSPVTLFLVDDDEVSVMAVSRALKKLRIVNPLVTAKDGLEALEILRGENGRERLRAPYLVLLDINMPRMGGFEFLEVVRDDPELSRMVVFVLTTSSDDEDIETAYQYHVAGYVVKSDAERTLQQAIEMIDSYWRIVELPSARA